MTIAPYHKNPASIHALLNPEPALSKRHSIKVKTTNTEGTTGNNSNGRPKRKRITPEQFRTLSDYFSQTDTPNHDLRDKISKSLNMTNREVQVWFQNRRAKANRIKLQEHIKLQEQQKLHQDYFHKGIILYNHNNYISSDQPLFASPPSSPPPLLRPSTNSHLCDSPTSTTIDSPTATCHYPDVSLDNMSPIDILATAAEYVQRCDQEKQHINISSSPSQPYISSTSWRPWN
ncbi:homeobox domain-containing protein [Chlamydoabsidia padenii]|nr:homeobox domain-containing protein [Chlamydoabsidia padenii]